MAPKTSIGAICQVYLKCEFQTDQKYIIMAKTSKLPKVRYILKNYLDKDGDKQIIATFRFPDGNLRYYTGEKVLPKYWGKGSAKESVNYSKGANINAELSKITEIIQSIYREATDKDIPLDEFRNEIDYRRGIKKRPKVKTELGLYEFIEKKIQNGRADVIGRTGQTWQKFQASFNHIKKYTSDYLGKEELSYDDIDEGFVKDYTRWLYNVKDHSQNTVSKEIRNLKQFLSDSRKYHNNTYYLDKDFKVDRKYIPKNYPTLNELRQLIAYQFEDESLQGAADLYLLSAFGGGLRISDVLRLSPQKEIDLEGEKVLQVFTHKGRNTKGDNEVIIPITPQLRTLIDKYEWKFPVYAEQTINRNLKRAFKEAGIDRVVQVKSAKKGSNEPVPMPLHNVVSFHTARYAYINYMLNDLDVSVEELQKITGQSIKILMGYVNGNKGRNAVKVGAKIYNKLAGLQVIKSEAV